MAMLIVRRGMHPEYYEFLTITARANGDELIVDRRGTAGSRSEDSPPEAAISNRRGPAAEKWIDEDVIVVRGKK